MALRLWTGPSGSGKTRFLFEYVLKEASEHPELNYIVIVPEQFTLSTQRQLIRLSKDHGIINVDVLSFARLAYKIFEEVGFKDARGVAIDDMGKNLILRHISSKFEENLSVFNGKMDRLGYITEVKSAISEFMQYGITVEKLSEMIEAAKNTGKGQLAAKLSDMQVLYREFNNYIDQKYITKEEMLTKAKRSAHKSSKLKKSVVVFDGFTGFTPVQYGFIESLLQIARDIHVSILMDTRDDVAYNTKHELFYLGYKTSEKLKKLAELNNIMTVNDFEIRDEIPRRYLLDHNDINDKNVSSKKLVHLERSLFREYSKPYFDDVKITSDTEKPTKVVDGDIGVFTALQPLDEVERVAVEIQKSIRNDHIKYKNIAIATGNLEEYAPLFKRVFKKYNIPYFMDRTFPVMMNPVIEYVGALVDIIADNFSYSAVFRYLRSPLTGYNTCDIDELENFVLKRGIKDYKGWSEDWVEKYSRYSKKRNQDGVIIQDEKLIAVDIMRKKVLEDISDIINLITDDKKIRGKKPTKAVNEINAAFTRVFERNEVENRLLNLCEQYSITDDTFESEHKKEYENVYSLVIDLFNRMEELLPNEEITYDEYGELLKAGFDEIRIGMIPSITDYIQIGDITRSRFDDIHTLFIVGANDGVIPKSGTSGGIITDIEKEFLISCTPDIELSPTSREQAYTGQLYLYMLMTKPTSRLCVSYSRLNSDSESLRPSYIIKLLTDMFPNIRFERDITDPIEKVYGVSSLYDVVVENIKNQEYEDLISVLVSDPVYGDEMKKNLTLAADASYMTGILERADSISRSVASVLYGKSIIGSVTRLEQYARCSFNYFLKYGLSLKEREICSFEAKDMGNIFHAVMEKYSTYLIRSGRRFEDVSDDEAREYVKRAIDECIEDPRYDVLKTSFRHQYMIERIYRVCLRSINVLTKHLLAGDFVPKGVEVGFSSTDSLDALTFKLSDDEIMRFTGSIDRLDTYSCEGEDNSKKIYLKIIDYKSGNKNLNLIEVYKGLSLQLVVYMNAAMEIVGKEAANADAEIVPAGILYYHIDDPIVEGTINDADEDIYSRILKQLKMNGIVNSDEEVYRHIDRDFEKESDIIPVSVLKSGDLSKKSSAMSTEDFMTVSKYVNRKIEDMGREILSGCIKAEPHTASGVDESACTYCPYTDMCHFSDSVLYDTAEQEPHIDDVLEEMRKVIGESSTFISSEKKDSEEGAF